MTTSEQKTQASRRRLHGSWFVAFALGILLGAWITDINCKRAAQFYLEQWWEAYVREQTSLAAEAERSGDRLSAVLHRGAVAETTARLAERERWNFGEDMSWFTFTACYWDSELRHADPSGKAEENTAAHAAMMYAQTLDWAGYCGEAQEQWREAGRTLGWTEEHLKQVQENEFFTNRASALGLQDDCGG